MLELKILHKDNGSYARLGEVKRLPSASRDSELMPKLGTQAPVKTPP